MIPVLIDYATPSALETDRDQAFLGLTASARRPVRFHGRVARNTFLLRTALRALGEAIWSSDTWLGGSAFLDPVITVHPDGIFFEAFSQDQSVYVLCALDPDLFEIEGEVTTGTTNVDFTAWLWSALAELRSARETWFRVESGGFEVKTTGAGGRYERKVELPDPWVRGFLNLQGAMAMPGTMITARPVDLLAAIRYLRYTKAKVSPRALRYEFEPDREARIVLEPWEKVVPLKNAEHNYAENRVIRTWGRRRLRLIEPLLPFADSVDIFLKGRALPSFYAVHLDGIDFVLGLSGWTAQTWTADSHFSLSADIGGEAEDRLALVLEGLKRHFSRTSRETASETGFEKQEAERLLIRLCRRGQAFYDVRRRSFRHRELFENPVEEDRLFPPDLRREKADELVRAGRVTIGTCQPRETRRIKRMKTAEGRITREIIHRDWEISGAAGDQDQVEVVLSDTGRIIFGQCSCPFFQENLLNLGPCEHMLAVYAEGEKMRRDLPASVEASEEEAARHRSPSRFGEDRDDHRED